MPSYIDQLLHQLRNPDVPLDPLDEAQARWNRLPGEKRNKYIRQASTMTALLKDVEQQGRLGPGKNQQALQELGIGSRTTLKSYIEECQRFQRIYPHAPLALAFVNLAGRPKRTILTSQEQLLAIGAYAYTDWNVLIHETLTLRTKMKLQAEHIYSLLLQIFPEVQNKIKVDGLKRFLDDVVRDDQATFTLAWEGEKAVWEKFLIKLPNNVSEPNERWQSDARVLPFYILNDDGVPTTVTLVSILDEFSRIVPEWDIVPRIESDAQGEQHRVDFKRDHVCLLLARTMLKLKVRCQCFYTDNGSQYVALRLLLPYLTDSGDEGIRLVFGFPQHPWGRGKIEVMQKLVDMCLRGVPGFVEDESDLGAWAKAREAAKLKLEDLRKILKRFFKRWNRGQREEQPSRFEVWQQTEPQSRTPAPPADRLFHLGFVGEWKTPLVHDSHIQFNKEFYRLKYINDASRQRWIDAVGHARPVWSLSYDDLDGRHVEQVFASLDGRTFDALIPTIEQRPPAQRRVREQQSDLNMLHRRRSTLAEAFLILLHQQGIDIATTTIDTVEKTTILGNGSTANNNSTQDTVTTPETDTQNNPGITERASQEQQSSETDSTSSTDDQALQHDDQSQTQRAAEDLGIEDSEPEAPKRASFIDLMKQRRSAQDDQNR